MGPLGLNWELSGHVWGRCSFVLPFFPSSADLPKESTKCIKSNIPKQYPGALFPHTLLLLPRNFCLYPSSIVYFRHLCQSGPFLAAGTRCASLTLETFHTFGLREVNNPKHPPLPRLWLRRIEHWQHWGTGWKPGLHLGEEKKIRRCYRPGHCALGGEFDLVDHLEVLRYPAD